MNERDCLGRVGIGVLTSHFYYQVMCGRNYQARGLSFRFISCYRNDRNNTFLIITVVNWKHDTCLFITENKSRIM